MTTNILLRVESLILSESPGQVGVSKYECRSTFEEGKEVESRLGTEPLF